MNIQTQDGFTAPPSTSSTPRWTRPMDGRLLELARQGVNNDMISAAMRDEFGQSGLRFNSACVGQHLSALGFKRLPGQFQATMRTGQANVGAQVFAAVSPEDKAWGAEAYALWSADDLDHDGAVWLCRPVRMGADPKKGGHWGFYFRIPGEPVDTSAWRALTAGLQTAEQVIARARRYFGSCADFGRPPRRIVMPSNRKTARHKFEQARRAL